MAIKKYATGAEKSPYDIRTFSYKPDKANIKGGTRYNPEDIEDQSKVGICTSISLTQQARKATGIKYSADFQYLLQKKYNDGNWEEGSSISSALKIASKYGLLPEDKWTFTTQRDRDLGYTKYIAKLKKITDKQIEELLDIAKDYKIAGYASVPVNRDMLANAIDESEAGLLIRFVIGSEWWTAPIEPLRFPKAPISGHAITETNYDGNSFRIANSWGSDWADKGTAYHILQDYAPTEAWIVHYKETPPYIDDQKARRAGIIGKIMDLLQQIIKLLPSLI